MSRRPRKVNVPLNQTNLILSSRRSGNPLEIPTGDWDYEFSLQLPPEEIPPTFATMDDDVSYTAQATFLFEKGQLLDTSESATASSTNLVRSEVPFVTVNKVNLNTVHYSLEEIEVSNQQEGKSLLPCSAGTGLSAVMLLPKQGFVCGEALELNAEVSNDTKEEALVAVRILRSVECFDDKLEDTILHLPLDKVIPKQVRCFRELLRVPVTPATIEANIVRISHRIDLEVISLGGKASEPLLVQAPVTIGTIPHKHTFSLFDSVRDEQKASWKKSLKTKDRNFPSPDIQKIEQKNKRMEKFYAIKYHSNVK